MRYVVISEDAEAGLARKFAVMRPFLDERGWRFYLGTEANALGYGGIAAVARASGASETTVKAGAEEAADGEALRALPPGRSRRPGAGRPRAEDAGPGLTAALGQLLEPTVRGDPVKALTWTTASLRDMAREMTGRGHPCGKDAIARMLHGMGYSLQGAAKVLEGSQHPDRNGQFEYISAMIAGFTASGDPVISVDGKKREQLGQYWRAGQSWRPAGEPLQVRDHSFPDLEAGFIIPYGVYDIAANRGFVSVGTSHGTAAFAVNAIRLWWQREGQARYPGSRRLLVVCDAGGSNACSSRLWKHELALLAQEAGLVIEACHFPPGTSKWNKIEHRLSCHITRTWRGRPLMTAEDAVAGIAATTTYQGLKCTAVLDDGDYPTGREISDERMRHLEDRVLARHGEHGDWNYAVLPAPRPATGPEPRPGPAGPGPAMTAALAALAGIGDLPALLSQVTVPLDAAREQRLHLDRGGARRAATGPQGPIRIPLDAVIAATAARCAAGISNALLARLLGIGTSTMSQEARRITPALAACGITPRPGHGRIGTLARLTEHATARGITIPPPPETHSNHDTPETTR
jgi:hypothetical protein